jgi:hypothetical protein
MYIIFKDKKSKRSHKVVGIRIFLLFLLGDRRIQIRNQDAQKHVDPVDSDLDPDLDSDPDPQHWFIGYGYVQFFTMTMFLHWDDDLW